MNNFYVKPDLNSDNSEKVLYDYPEFPLYVQKGKVSFYRGYKCDSHWHTDIEFMAILDGHLKYNINGKIITINEGDGLFVNSGHLHFGYSDDNTDCTYICMLVHPVIFCQNSYIERTFISPIINDINHPYMILDKNDDEANKIITEIKDIFTQKQIGDNNYYLSVQSSLFNIMYQLNALLNKAPEISLPKHNFGKIKTMLDYISLHYSEKISLKDIAKSASISENTCTSVFRQFVSSTPFEFLIKYRIEKGMELLKNTDKTISEIAFDVGFLSTSYFTDTFRRETGTTPSTFRKIYKNM